MKRRDFIQKTALVSSSAFILPNIVFGKQEEDKKVRLGFIGVGLREGVIIWNKHSLEMMWR